MTNKRATRLLIVVFVGLLGLAALANVIRQNTGRTARPAATAEPYLFPEVLPTQITRIEIENVRFKRKLTLVRVPGDWIATDENGATVEIDLAHVPRMLQILSALRYNRILNISETDLGAFGLADGGWFIVRFDAGARYMLRVGEINAAKTDSYVQRGEGGQVYLAPYDKVGMLVRLVDGPASTATPATLRATAAPTISATP